jgi:hypothetical protein
MKALLSSPSLVRAADDLFVELSWRRIAGGLHRASGPNGLE